MYKRQILACAVLFGAGFRPRPLPAAAYAATGYSFAGALRAWKESLGPPLPEAVLLDVPVVYQWPEMPKDVYKRQRPSRSWLPSFSTPSR